MGKQRAKMPPSQRAKQFAPFDAVVGLRTALREKEKTRVLRKEISQDMAEEIDIILRSLETGDIITIVYYDEAEQNYIQITGEFENIDIKKRIVQIINKYICIDDIGFIEKH